MTTEQYLILLVVLTTVFAVAGIVVGILILLATKKNGGQAVDGNAEKLAAVPMAVMALIVICGFATVIRIFY